MKANDIIPRLTGSDRQIAWATTIINAISVHHPGIELPDNLYAGWWIRNRLKSIDEIVSTSKESLSSPFTREFPQYGRSDAISTAKKLVNFIVIDTETTGLTHEDEIIEIAIVNCDTGNTLMNTLVRPSDMSKVANNGGASIHKINPDVLTIVPTFQDIADELYDILRAYHVVAYNAAFDIPAIQREFFRVKLPIPVINGTCAMRMFSAYMGIGDWLSLAEACSILGIDVGEQHRALGDALATCEVIKQIKECAELVDILS